MAALAPTPVPNGPFTLARATPDDILELVDVEYDCFPPFIHAAAMGILDYDTDMPKLRQKYIDQMTSDPADIWIKVVDSSTGKIIAGSNWRIYLNGPPTDRPMDTAPEWLEGEHKEKSEAFVGQAEETRLKIMKGVAFINLHICFTSPAYRRRGAGSMMLKWGCEVADLLGLAGWIEASEEGNYLYKVHGFYDHSKVEGEIEGVNMMRDAKAWATTGGK